MDVNLTELLAELMIDISNWFLRISRVQITISCCFRKMEMIMQNQLQLILKKISRKYMFLHTRQETPLAFSMILLQ